MMEPLAVLRRLPAHDESITGLLESRRAEIAGKTFLIYEGRRWTGAEFLALTDRMAGLLATRGIGRGDRVSIMSRNHPAHLLLLFAAARLGAVMVPINPEFRAAEARYVLEHAEPKLVIAAAETLAVVQEALTADVPVLLADGAAPGAPGLDQQLAEAPPPPPPATGRADDTVIVIYTSGTTGKPKGAMHSQRSFVLAGEAYIQRVHLQPDDRVLIVLPLFHMNALFYSTAGALAAGLGIVLVPRFSASGFWDTVKETGATVVNMIDAVGAILAGRPRSEFREGHGLRAVLGLRQRAAPVFRDEFKVPHLFAGFGMTEIPGVTCTPLGQIERGSSMGVLGRHPDPQRPWAEARVVDEAGNPVPDGVTGELEVKTPIIMQGYFRDPEQTAAAFRDGWFMTGDLVRREADGWFFFVGRKKDIIRRRGENIAGAELDMVIAAHPAVLEVAAIAVAAELGEDEILAAVVRRPGHALSAAEVAAWCRERLAPMKVPRYVAFLDALPHTPTHKVAKHVLRADPELRRNATDLQA